MRDPVTGLVPAVGAELSLVIGELQWTDVTGLRAGTARRERTRSVGFLSVPALGTWCTGVLVAPDVLVTAAPCVKEPSETAGASVYFRRETGVPQAEWAEYTCDQTLLVDSEVAFVRCSGRPGDVFGVPELRAGNLAPSSDVYVVQQACNHFASASCTPDKRFAPGAVVRAREEILYDADAVEGALGAPVFSVPGHDLVGLHLGGAAAEGANRAARASTMRELALELDLDLGGRASVYGAPPPPPDPFEPNDDGPQATTVVPGFSSDDAWIGEDDRDIFRVDLVPAQELDLLLTFDHARGDIDVSVHRGDPEGVKIASGVSASDDERVIFSADRNSPYFLVVYGYQGATNEYAIGLR
ncbi:MAG: trypsin-like peptidase domain-containing protein [Myxococcota bacterium]